MRLVVGVPEAHITKRVLEPTAEAVTRLDEDLIRSGKVPTFHEALRRGAVKWRPEPPGEERFDHAEKVLHRGWGDCDDLAPWRAASARATGEDPGARVEMLRRSPTLWHAVVRRSDGSREDPSAEAGMRRSSGSNAPAIPLMQQTSVVGGAPRPQLALRPIYGVRHCIGWEARCDLPMSRTASALCELHHAPVASQAIIGACNGATIVADASGTLVMPETYAPIDAISGLLQGVSAGEIDVACGELARERAEQWLDHADEVCGDLFGDIAHAARKVAHVVQSATHVLTPVLDVAKTVLSAAQGVVSLIPGVGTGISAAISAGLGMLSGGTPVEIAIRTAYGAIPIPPGIRNITDMVLDSALSLLRSGDIGEAAIAAVRSKIPAGIPQQVFDTLVHIISHAIHKKPTMAVATPRPGVHPSTPIQMKRVAVPRPAFTLRAPLHVPHGFNVQHAAAAAARAARPYFMAGMPAHASYIAPAGIAFG